MAAQHRKTAGLCALLALLSIAQGGDEIFHALDVRLDPASHTLSASDTISLPERLRGQELQLSLHAGLALGPAPQGWSLEPVAGQAGHGVQRYRVRPVEGQPAQLLLSWAGSIEQAPTVEGEEYARSFSSTAGTISEQGVYLAGSSHWLPQFGAELFGFALTVRLPAGWQAVSQGRRSHHELGAAQSMVRWSSPEPGEEVYLVAARFHEYERAAGAVMARVFLREADPTLAATYLEVTAQYLQLYARLLGPYPYTKFALVENFWETGYGMPSFTLLGPKIIRFPFILHSSYPHEILHNWWGNGVYVDADGGNWCEGLTAYLADHLIKEGQGKGAEYRRDTLKKYRSYVGASADFPLTQFRSRHSGATEAVGYGKSLMLWHMLRMQLGDEMFVSCLARVYRRYRFARASFEDIEAVFSATAELDLGPVFRQWTERTGAPELSLEVEASGTGWRVRLEQVQPEAPYILEVPVAILCEGEPQPRIESMHFVPTLEDPRVVELTLPAGSRPVWVRVDPGFDLFRRLHSEEIPPSLGAIFGAERVSVILPEAASGCDWEQLAAAWDPTGEQLELLREAAIDGLPAGRPVWILGQHNRWAEVVRSASAARDAVLEGGELRVGEESVAAEEACFVLTARHPQDPELSIGWIGASLPESLPGLARKLPHYGKYSYLAFTGNEPSNVIKGQWQADASPLLWRAPGYLGTPSLPTVEPLARLEPVFDADRLAAHVAFLASDALEGRGVGTAGLDKAADYIVRAFESAGLEPGGSDGGWFQEWLEPDGPDGAPVRLRNVVGVLRGSHQDWARQSVVVGAHYDHLGRGWPDVREGMAGQIHNGADDNASGVAVLLELAGLLGNAGAHPRSIVFVAFSAEEWQLRGSRHYTQAMEQWPAEQAHAMLNLDTVGRLAGQRLLVLGTGTASEWVHIVRGVGFTTGVEGVAVANDLGGSDQKSFHELGVPAVQLTTGPTVDYHRPSDVADKVDADGLVKVATWLRETLVYLAAREEPLSSTLAGGTSPAPAPAAGRRVSLGTMPDFADPGPGVRVQSVLEASAAEEAGIEAGDRLLSLDGVVIEDLRAFSDFLKTRKPGDSIRIELERDGERLSLEAKLRAR